MKATYTLAMAAGRDAGNRNMRKNCRTVWAQEDFEAAAKVTAKILRCL